MRGDPVVIATSTDHDKVEVRCILGHEGSLSRGPRLAGTRRAAIGHEAIKTWTVNAMRMARPQSSEAMINIRVLTGPRLLARIRNGRARPAPHDDC